MKILSLETCGNNILYVGSEHRVVLVDFDWAGKNGECRYPVTLNPGDFWAEDVLPYGIMRKAHDLWQLDRLNSMSKWRCTDTLSSHRYPVMMS